MRWFWLASAMLGAVASPVLATLPQAVSCDTTKRLASERQIEAAIYHAGPTNYRRGNVDYRTDANGVVIAFGFDWLGCLTTVTTNYHLPYLSTAEANARTK